MNQAILWLFLLQPILDNEIRDDQERFNKKHSKENTLDHTVHPCFKNRRRVDQQAVYKVCA